MEGRSSTELEDSDPLEEKFSGRAASAGFKTEDISFMTGVGFALFCLLGFAVPVPLLAWLDRPRHKTRRDAQRGDP